MATNWIYTKENQIFTIVQTRVTKKYLAKYPNMRFTQNAEPNNTDTAFPTILFKYLPVPEIGTTIDNNGINGIMCTLQVEVATSKSQGQYECMNLAWDLVDEIHKLLFSVALSPEVLSTGNDTHKVVFRMRRVIGANDKIQ